MATIHLAVSPIYRQSLLIEFDKNDFDLNLITGNKQVKVTGLTCDEHISLIETHYLIKWRKIDTLPEPIVILGPLKHLYLLIETRKLIRGFITLDESFGTLSGSIKNALNGHWIMSPAVNQFFQMSTLQQQKTLLEKDFSRSLTRSELEILNEISKGKTNRQIAEQRFRSIHTVKTQRKQIRQKLNLSGREALGVFTARYSNQIHTLLSVRNHPGLFRKMVQNTPV